ncbi:MAG: glycosyltransferase [bacterium]|nr:glycosyltransferase [bacterium]
MNDLRWHVAPENDYRAVAALPLAPEPTVTVVIPVYNRIDLLHRTLSGLVSSSYPKGLLEIVVADDGSEEDVSVALADLGDELRVTVVRQEHVGYGAGRARNLGATKSNGEVVVFIDADCIPDPDLVARHVQWHRRADNLVVIGSRHHLDASQITHQQLAAGSAGLRDRVGGRDAGVDPMVPDDFRRLFYRRTARLRTGDDAFRSLVSSNFSIRRDRFLESGGFAEDFNRWGGEDTELGWRLFNAGLYFVPEDEAAIYHQTQEDGGDAPEWRQDARFANDGIIQAKIPHRFYRKSQPGYVYETPKVSWIVTPAVDKRADEIWDQILAQSYTDFEVILLGGGPVADQLGEMLVGDPRLVVIPPEDSAHDQMRSAVDASRGEYIALLHGWASLDHRLLGRAVRRLEGFPRTSLLRCGYQVVDSEGAISYVYDDAIADIDDGWQSNGLPIFALSRRREWAKAMRLESDLAGVWRRVVELSETRFMRDAMVAVPGPGETGPMPDRFPAVTGERSHLMDDLTQGGLKRAATAASSYAFAKARRRPYRPVETGLPERVAKAASPETAQPPGITYIGWLGKSNYGDDIMLQSIQGLLPDAVVGSHLPAQRRMVMLGGGTLINRARYLGDLRRYDTPRVERAVFGSGVADPDYWGLTEPVPEWLNFLDRCGYVGVRGPRSAALLREWDYAGSLEVVGDPALSILPPTDVSRNEGLVVVSPAWTDGELWGGTDDAVFAALAATVRSLRDAGREIAYLSCFAGDDRHIMEIMRQSGSGDARYLAAYDDIEGGVALLAEAGVVIAERLHAAVIAAACETPFVAIEYRPKIRDFASSIEQEAMVIRSDEVGREQLLGLVEQASSGAMTAELKVAVAVFRKRQKAAAAQLMRLLDS